MRFTDNPFLLLVQLFLALLDHAGDRIMQLPSRMTHGSDTADVRPPDQLHAPTWDHRWILQSATTCADHYMHLGQVATPPDWAIYCHPTRAAATGHGSATRMRFTDNPFLLLVQLFLALLDHAGDRSMQLPSRMTHGSDTADVRPPDQLHAPTWDHRWILQSATTCADHYMHLGQVATPPDWAIYCHPTRAAATGHGSATRMRFTDNPFLLLVQVRKRYGVCIRSNNPFLLVLPCPRLLFDVTVSLRKLLLLGGDIEANPGPDTAQILTQLQEIASDIKEIKEKRLADIDNKLDALARLEKQVTSCQEQVAQMSEVIERLEERIDDLDNRSRRCNLIVYGLSESEEETKETLRERVNKDIVQDKLDLDAVAIERIHRLGQPAGNKIRPVIMKLLDYREKESILKRGFKLKNSDLSIGEDFSRKIRDIRKKLWDSAKPNRDNGDKVSLSFNKLYINGQAFVWDSENAVKVPFGKKNDKATTRESQNDNVSSHRMTRRRANSKK
ncbi:uncharacterized protein LOC144105085 [Amblyomma americanum]